MALEPERVRSLIVGVAALLAALLLTLPLALAPRAQAFIYWAGGSAIGRANLDGTGVDQSFIGGLGLIDVAVDGEHVYWTGCADPSCVPTTSAIGRANLDGSDANHSFIAATGLQTQGIAVDAKHVYWTAADPHVVARANLDGSGVDRSFITMSDYQGIYERSGVAVDAHHVYWTQIEAPNGVSAIGRANLDGTNVERSFIPDTFGATDVAVDAEHIYWTAPSLAGGVVGRANLDGTGVERTFMTGLLNRMSGVAVDAEHLYGGQDTIVGSGRYTFVGSIGRANLDGTGMDQEFLGGPSEGWLPRGGLAVDDLTDTGLAGKASAKRTQKQRGKKVRIAVKIKAKERLRAKITGKIKVNPTYKLKSKSVNLDAGKARTLNLKPKRKAQAKRIVGALKRGRRGKAKVKVKLTDLVGNSKTEKLQVRLKAG